MKPLSLLDLFSGIGGFSLGLERSGLCRTVAFCEIDPFCRRVLAKHWPDVPCAEDVTTREFIRDEADVVCGGFPCQDLSFAGVGAGLSGSRSGLWRELLRAIRVVRPRYAIVENVAALLSRGMGVVLGDLAEIGFDAEWHCIPASAVGAPHVRDRVWIIAHARGVQHEGDRAPLGGALAAELSGADSDADGEGELQQGRSFGEKWGWAGDVRAEVSDAGGAGLSLPELEAARGEAPGRAREGRTTSERGWWASEPDVGRVAHGVPSRVDRLKGLGNAVVPQVPEIVGRAILSTWEAA